MNTIEILHLDEPCGWSGLAPLAMGLETIKTSTQLVVEKTEPGFVIAHAEVTNSGPTPVRIKGIRWTHPASGM